MFSFVVQFSHSVVSNSLWSHGLHMPGYPVYHQLLVFSQTHVHQVGDAIQPSHPLSSPFPPAFNLAHHWGLFLWVSSSCGWSIGVSASASVLPMNIHSWFPLGLTGLISLQSKGLSRVFPSTTVWKHQFFGTQPSLWTNSRIRTWLLETSMISYSTFIHEYTVEYI